MGRQRSTTSRFVHRRVKPELPGGFRDYGTGDTRTKQWIVDTARRTFELFGFEPIETSAVHRAEVLTTGEADSQKIIYGINPLSGAEAKESKHQTALRFDLTVPLARFIAKHPEIPKPFKRYEIGRVWRGERQQAGRYREFTQADIDIVGSDSPVADAEIIAIIYTLLLNLGIGKFVIRINDRKEFDSLPAYAGFTPDRLWDALRIIDKREKIGASRVSKELGKTFGEDSAEKIMRFLSGAPGVSSEGFGTLEKELDVLGVGRRYWNQDRSMVRGLAYYTGFVFEATLLEAPEVGSVFGGGRYDDLIKRFTDQSIPAVGASLGVDRLLAAMQKLGLDKKAASPLQVLILNLKQEFREEYLEFVGRLRSAGVAAGVFLGKDRAFEGQLAYAVKKEIPYVLIYGAAESKKGIVALKNLVTREQREVPKEKIIPYFRP